jgi:uncharacterized protein (TIGR00299 family) protein
MILFYDCFSGISGDMHLGAMIDLGCPVDYLRGELTKIPIDGYELRVTREMKGGIMGTRVEILVSPVHKVMRHYREIIHLIEESSLKPTVKVLSLRIFRLLAEGEGRIHGCPVEDVHFHELGAVDSIVDIVGAAIAIDYFRPAKVIASPVEMGSGTARCSHGVFPVPAPATAQILQGVPIKIGGQPFEATTPTGAAILMATVDSFSPEISIIPKRIGYGIGHREGNLPNVLRVILGEEGLGIKSGDIELKEAVVLETNIDDMSPEETGHLIDLLLAHGAQDVYLTPIIMKKSRPAVKVSVICDKAMRTQIEELLFLNSSTFGLRSWSVTKSTLRREFSKRKTPYGEISVKKGIYQGQVIKEKPEYEECQKIAREHNLTLKQVFDSLKKDERD